MSTDPIAKSGPTCPYSTHPGFIRPARLVLGILPVVAFAIALAGCQHVPIDLSHSPIAPTPASDHATTGSRKVGVPDPQTRMQTIPEVSVSDYLPNICQEIRDLDQNERCFRSSIEINNNIHAMIRKFHDTEFDRRMESLVSQQLFEQNQLVGVFEIR